MLTSEKQLKASIKALSVLMEAIEAPVNPDIPAMLVKANRRKVQQKIDAIQAEIDEYQSLKTLAVSEIKVNSLVDLLKAPIRYRISKGETVDAFAKEVSVNKRQILRYEEKAYENCSIPTLMQILEKIGMHIEGHIE
ncbi:hypothetical protein KIH87_11905 [Paraneptunicella aestuarii]|uniref:hypothetical protein n=1 Tax=Paraneptunicella aestuarii TaxID=2831148 RepID=UPI001E645C99|nr:hypothetical protein [Paraneptunicella aestuarii]UAA37418.1 hypothetical protein KIH87_11905 [Paraneptunicella aestuarii]